MKLKKKLLDKDIKDISTQGFNKLTSKNVTARLTQENLASITDIPNFVKEKQILRIN